MAILFFQLTAKFHLGWCFEYAFQPWRKVQLLWCFTYITVGYQAIGYMDEVFNT